MAILRATAWRFDLTWNGLGDERTIRYLPSYRLEADALEHQSDVTN